MCIRDSFGAGQFIPCEELTAGMVGYITASIKNLGDTRVGDTVTDKERPCAEAVSYTHLPRQPTEFLIWCVR